MKKRIIKYIGSILIFLGGIIPIFHFSKEKILEIKDTNELEKK